MDRKKADWRVFPMLCILFGLSLLDRTNISSSYIAGLDKDLKLNVGNRYNIALLVFFIGERNATCPSIVRIADCAQVMPYSSSRRIT
jgi:hypothetical protein